LFIDNCFVKDSRLQILLVAGLLILLGTLAFLQYKWLSEISESEKERLQKRLEIDAQHFAEDFNKTIQITYYNFQVDETDWQTKIPERYETWHNNSPYPDLIKGVDLIFENGEAFKFDLKKRRFERIERVSNFADIQNNFQPIDEEKFILKMPIYQTENPLLELHSPNTRMLAPPQGGEGMIPAIPPGLRMPAAIGFLLIKLDEDVIRNRIFSDLSLKYFPDADYRFAVTSQRNQSTIFQNARVENPDINLPMLNLLNDNFAFFVNQDLASAIRLSNLEKGMIINKRFESRVSTQSSNSNGSVKIQVMNGNPQMLERQKMPPSGLWLLQIQHQDGSLEKFVGNTKRKNLFVSFGILGLLGVSAGLIFLSAHRAQILAQRQMDFVSAVSHEFRTPLAVIYSAGENLADGVAREGPQVSRYGNLIKGEGKKLSGMVEQILEFAGARSGKKKYHLVETDPQFFIFEALAECRPLLDENDFRVETEISENLPTVIADENAMSHAIQNLIINAIKYSNGHRWLKISAENGDGQVKISVEDSGIGISKKDLKQIFSPFFRAKNVVDAQIHGNGLGLSLVKQTIDAHHGQIRVESEVGKGSKFIIQLPIVSIQKMT
jgi:signal transduction histidine kinase